MVELKRPLFGPNIRRLAKLFAVKPVLIIYGLQYAITGPVSSQLWLDRVCLVNLGYNQSICGNLTSHDAEENLVQEKVSQYNIVGGYIETIPSIIMGLYLGPLSDKGRKLLMFLPFLGHVISGTFYLAFIFFHQWPAQYLWITSVYNLFGGYTVLQIAMYGYIGDVTNDNERTTLMSILAGLGIAVFPLADFLSGQIYNAGGYYAVYGTSLAFTIIGLGYIYVIPESVTLRTSETDPGSAVEKGKEKVTFTGIVKKANSSLIDGWKCLVKKRPNGTRTFIIYLLLVMTFAEMGRTYGSSFLYTQKKFDWSVSDYTNYISFYVVIVLVRTFVTTPIYSYYLHMHDFMICITGITLSIASTLVTGFATRGWMMYYAACLTIIGGMDSTPLRSILSKMVQPHEYGKIFTLTATASSIASLVTSSVYQEVYSVTVSTFPGAVYILSASIVTISLVMVCVLYYFVILHERKFGPIGSK